MLENEEQIRGAPGHAVFVAYDELSLLEAKVMRDLRLPFPLVIDRERRWYAEWQLGRTNLLGAMLSPSLNWRYLRLLLRGERFLGFAPDMFQLGADFVVDGAGIVRFAHRMRDNGDRAAVATLLGALRDAAATA